MYPAHFTARVSFPHCPPGARQVLSPFASLNSWVPVSALLSLLMMAPLKGGTESGSSTSVATFAVGLHSPEIAPASSVSWQRPPGACCPACGHKALVELLPPTSTFQRLTWCFPSRCSAFPRLQRYKPSRTLSAQISSPHGYGLDLDISVSTWKLSLRLLRSCIEVDVDGHHFKFLFK